MIVVSNATPIISLSCIEKIQILELLFTNIYIPFAVYNEIKKKRLYGYNEVDEPFFIKKDITMKQFLNLLTRDLDQGESEAILLAKELNADILLIDERLGLQIAKNEKIDCIGTLTVLRLAKEKNIIQEGKPLLLDLKKKGRWYSDQLMEHFLKSIGESY
jgi:uncharacterized protein